MVKNGRGKCGAELVEELAREETTGPFIDSGPLLTREYGNFNKWPQVLRSITEKTKVTFSSRGPFIFIWPYVGLYVGKFTLATLK